MTRAAASVDRAKLRRIALARQGLLGRQPFGRGRGATLRAIRHLGYVQIDTISVVARAHDHVMSTRVPGFRSEHLDRLMQDRLVFEYGLPVAAFRPIEEFRFSLPRMRRLRSKPRAQQEQRLVKQVLKRIRDEGPLKSRDFEDPAPSRKGRRKGRRKGWWDWKPAKRALELLCYQGDLLVSARDGFQKSYDLTERVLPDQLDTSEPGVEEVARHMIDSTLRAHGFATQKSFAHEARGMGLNRAVNDELQRRTAAGELLAFSDEHGVWWCEPEILDGPTPRASTRAVVLSPFDNAITQRERVLKVFGFDYRIECFVPRAERRFGYFCLPILYRDRLIGRMDCKSHRDAARFEVKALFYEPDFAARKRVEQSAAAVSRAIVDFARFDGCDDVVVTRTEPAFARLLLNKALRRL